MTHTEKRLREEYEKARRHAEELAQRLNSYLALPRDQRREDPEVCTHHQDQTQSLRREAFIQVLDEEVERRFPGDSDREGGLIYVLAERFADIMGVIDGLPLPEGIREKARAILKRDPHDFAGHGLKKGECHVHGASTRPHRG